MAGMNNMGLRESVVSISAGATVPVVAVNPARRYLRIQNTGANPVVVGLAATVSPSGPSLAAGASLTFDAMTPTNAMWASAAAAATLSVWEGY